ncbi:hypothetical protein, partial [uncultured Desulfovibrio sp.]|uniref:hypothetical protein n=1 Tax=uncultured Desulfovibrio sp. TaxID=167968 RepID=UPI002608A5C4
SRCQRLFFASAKNLAAAQGDTLTRRRLMPRFQIRVKNFFHRPGKFPFPCPSGPGQFIGANGLMRLFSGGVKPFDAENA